MERKGSIFVKREGEKWLYALHPFAIGIFEAQLKSLTPSYYLDTREYMLKKFGVEYLTTDVPQARVIPVSRSIDTRQNVATYDEIRALVERAGDSISVQECICRVGKDLINDPCRRTDRREVCIGFRDMADMWVRNGWGRKISQQEALDLLAKNEEEGLMLFASTAQEPQFVCSCCSCCCGLTNMLRILPRPADFAASNFEARVDPDLCNGCRECRTRCQLGAITYEGPAQTARVNTGRCVGCGVCVPTCEQGAITLHEKPTRFVPPRDHEALYSQIQQNKPGPLKKTVKVAKAMLGRKV
jgi:ferredoxin